MQYIEMLNGKLDELHLLKHPLYQAWNAGQLDNNILKLYAEEYYHHVAAFPRYISGIHAQCDDISARQVLLGNLKEEEEGEENHPELWKRFAEGLGCVREKFASAAKQKALLHSTNQLVQGYFELVQEGYAKGLGALYAYERQTPEVAKTKIEGLIKFYNLNDERALQFFKVHITADEWHSEECAALIAKLSPQEQLLAQQGAEKAAKLLWQFLDGIFAVWEMSADRKYAC